MKGNFNTDAMQDWRDSAQEIVPLKKVNNPKGEYNLYPTYEIGTDKILRGFDSIAECLKNHDKIIIDGYIGVFWTHFREQLNAALQDRQINAQWMDVSNAMLPEKEINALIEPFLGGDDPIFGTRFDGSLSDFFDSEKLSSIPLQLIDDTDLTIIYGCGASLVDLDAKLLYIDLPKNEIQFRSRAKSITNLGASAPDDEKKMYKQFYFVDWVALNRHKEDVLPKIDWFIDEQHHENPAIMKGADFRDALSDMSTNYFRVRPWFEPGVWGGQWCKEHIPQLPQDVENLAWSFELIAPENGLLFSSDDEVIEASFDWLMYQEHEAVIGDAADQFGYEFPIRFDFLDTVEGGNLSVQCHPNPSFIRENFGEPFTQDETYYILDSNDDSEVYLGFQDDIDPQKFREQLEHSNQENEPVDIKEYVQTFPSNTHDLFLIPNETIHCSGQGNLVLEISATPYIFTFKMYDWLRTNLSGKPRPINIERAFKNLNFERKGKRVEKELISKPSVIKEQGDSRIIHLPTHEDHFYDVQRLEFAEEISIETDGSCHVMSLVEGSSIILETKNGVRARFSYAETFAIPAAAESYRLINEGEEPAKVVKAFVKSGAKI